MASKAKRPAVRFHLGSLQKTTAFDGDLTKENENAILEQGRDSGAPSPDLAPAMQPASARLLHNQQRITILNSINDVLRSRVEHEASRSTLTRLHDELRSRLHVKTRDCRNAKSAKLISTRKAKTALELERDTLVAQVTRMKEHAEAHEREHAGHTDSNDELNIVPEHLNTTADLKVSKDKRPSKKADQRLATSRLLREVQQLRTRLTALEKRILAENRRKKQAESELAILRAAISRQKGTRTERAPLKPLWTGN